MPDFWSHRYAAQSIYEREIIKHQRFSKLELKYYLLGAQGPDLFYYLNKTHLFTRKHFKRIGNNMHTQDILEVFTAFITNLSPESPELFAYTLGFLIHYQMDAHCHPYICTWGPDSKSHKVVEMALDALTVYHYKGYPVQKETIQQLHPNSKEITPQFTAFLNASIPNLNIKHSDLRRINKDFSRLQWILIKDIVGKLPLKERIAELIGYDLRGIRYEKDLKKIQSLWDTDAYFLAFEKGILVASKNVQQLIQLNDSPEKQIAYINQQIVTDYLGEPLKL